MILTSSSSSLGGFSNRYNPSLIQEWEALTITGPANSTITSRRAQSARQRGSNIQRRSRG